MTENTFCMYGYNHSLIPVCPGCGPTRRYLAVPVRILLPFLVKP